MHIQEFDFDRLGFAEINALRPEIWRRLSNEQKIYVLQECSNRICDFEKRPRTPVELVNFNQYRENKGLQAAFNGSTKTIGITPQYLRRADTYEIFGTLIHESMHGYQHHAVTTPGFHQNTVEVKEWWEGFKEYKSPNISYRAYRLNPLEIHASAYEKQFSRILKREHELQKSLAQLKNEANRVRAQKNEKKRFRKKDQGFER